MQNAPFKIKPSTIKGFRRLTITDMPRMGSMEDVCREIEAISWAKMRVPGYGKKSPYELLIGVNYKDPDRDGRGIDALVAEVEKRLNKYFDALVEQTTEQRADTDTPDSLLDAARHFRETFARAAQDIKVASDELGKQVGHELEAASNAALARLGQVEGEFDEWGRRLDDVDLTKLLNLTNWREAFGLTDSKSEDPPTKKKGKKGKKKKAESKKS